MLYVWFARIPLIDLKMPADRPDQGSEFVEPIVPGVKVWPFLHDQRPDFCHKSPAVVIGKVIDGGPEQVDEF